MMPTQLPVGAGSAYTYRLRVQSADVDLSLATAAVFRVRNPKGLESEWVPTTFSWVAPRLVVSKVMAGELTIGGVWIVTLDITLPSGVVTTLARKLEAIPRFAVME